jgi:hypothetical protein
MKNIIKAMARKSTVVCATVLTVIGTTVNAAAVTSAGTSTKYMTNHTIQQNPSSLVTLGLSSVSIYNTLNTDVNQKDVVYVYDPFSEVIEIQFTDDQPGNRTVFLNKTTYSKLCTAYDQYLKDIPSLSQTNKEKNSSSIYGTESGVYQYNSIIKKVKTDMGYTFINGKSYFTLSLYNNLGTDGIEKHTILLTEQQAANLVSYASVVNSKTSTQGA